MCDAMTAISAGGSLMSAMGQADAQKSQAAAQRVQGQAALSEAALDKELRNKEATDIMAAAVNEADNIKRQALLMRGQIAVAQSGSGVMIGEGSAQAAMDQLDALSSADALAALYSGVNKSVNTRASGRFAYEAGVNKNKAHQQAAKSLDNAAQSTMLSGIAGAAGSALKGFGTPATKTVPKN